MRQKSLHIALRPAKRLWRALTRHFFKKQAEPDPFMRASTAGQSGTRDPAYTLMDERGRARRVTLPLIHPPAGNLIVVVQAYDPGMFKDIAALLRGIAGHFSLCVTVPTAKGKSLVERAVAASGLDVRLDCRVTHEEGMNAGALFAAFAHDVLRHDLVLHLHTTREFDAISNLLAWPRECRANPSGTPALIDTILAMFSSEPDLGLLYPDNAKGIPYWAHFCQPHEAAGRQLQDRLGLAHSAQTYFDFPAGGMFWARVEAIRPMFEGLGEADVPRDSGYTAERIMTRLTSARGYRFAAYDAADGVFRSNWSMRNLAQYSRTSPQDFASILESVDLVSFDIFDTIVTRPALEPDSVLHYAGHRIAMRYPGVTNFFERRKAAEFQARRIKQDQGDVDLDEIYAAFEPGDEWTPELIRYAAALEREVDGAALRPRPGMEALLRAARLAGKRVIAISDTYYTQSDIERILARAGLGGAFDHLYISAVAQARKDRGALWDHVAQAESVAAGRWLHAGDNERSDIQAARQRGVQVFHTMHPARLLENFGFRAASAAEGPRWAADLAVGPAMLRLAGSPFLAGRPFKPWRLQTAADVGYVVFGPVLFLFYAWLIRHPALRQVRQLYFLSREGYVLEQLHTRVRQRFPALALPPGHYVYTSRRVAVCAAQAAVFSPEKIMAGAGFTGSLRDFLRHRLGLELDEQSGLEDWQVALPRDAEKLRAALLALQPVITRHATGEREKLIAYAKQSGMLEPGLQGVVDIGYSATIQQGLQTALSIPLTGFYMASFDTARQVEDGGGQAFGCVEENIRATASNAPVLKNPFLMEAFLTAAHGQVTGFVEARGRIVPVFKAASLTGAEAGLLAEMHQGALDYCMELLEVFGTDLLYAGIAKELPQEFFRMVMDGNLILPEEVAAMLRVEDEFCGNGQMQVGLGAY